MPRLSYVVLPNDNPNLMRLSNEAHPTTDGLRRHDRRRQGGLRAHAGTGKTAPNQPQALGRGQRELIIGDRAIGKTTIAIDTIINQKTATSSASTLQSARRAWSVRRAINGIHASGAPERCIIVVAGSSSSPGLQSIAPFAGFTIAEYFRDRRRHALVVVDDQPDEKHAASHREIALLTRQSPGREAYPGDVFYLFMRGFWSVLQSCPTKRAVAP